ncbi:hypothetical protein PNA2_1903 [Pyrococcus sp. NA2]|uniref:ABC transporter substrate-binding protein n=1 Tax=Pyrococcus sp. (strain NA2) TaxID=342949 RepID=UPI000209AD7B|nr:ABC transporter substrate-binding protein [Pyrococcus sp. NA2]AEC52817.1 hypothetical protein PNA2_1903 [Pyrococcus sp. NA2]
MKKIGIMLLVVALGLLVSPIVNPVAAQEKKTLKIAMYAAAGSLFMSAWNPSAAGFMDRYSGRAASLARDDGPYTWSTEGAPLPYRCRILEAGENVRVPEDAVIFNSTSKEWVAAHAGEVAPTYVKFECQKIYFHDGHKLSVADVMYTFAWEWEWTTKDGPNDPYYDKTEETVSKEILSHLLGVKVISENETHFVIAVYHTYTFPPYKPFQEWYYTLYAGYPWQLIYAMSEVVAHNPKFSFSEATEEVQQIDMLTPSHARVVMEELEKLKKEKPIPDFLKPYIYDEQDELKEYDDIINFIKKHNHMFISNGPYIIDVYKPENLYLKYVRFDKWVKPEYAEDMYNFEPYFDVIELYGVQNEDTIILGVAKGDYDLAWSSFPSYRFTGLSDEERKNIDTYVNVGAIWSVVWNPVHDKDNPYLVTVGDKKYFNPFAIREIRFAMEYLINRNYIVQNILQGSGVPLFIPWISREEYASEKMQSVVDAFGLDAQGDEEYALKLIDEAMRKAAEDLAKQGYKLEKKNGKWYFNGEPIKLIGLGRSDNEGLKNEAYYIAEILKKAGFDVQVKIVDRRTANEIVYLSDPKNFEWNYYTEEWVASASIKFPIERVIVFYSSIANGPGRVGWRFTPQNTHRATVEEVLKYLGNGDLQAGIKALGLEYYNTPEKIKPLLNFTDDDLGFLIYLTGYKNIVLDSEEKFWDASRLGGAIGVYESFRVFTVEFWRFFPVNKRIKFRIIDPWVGIGSAVAMKSAYLAETPETTSKPSAEEKSPTATVESPSASETTKTKKGVCGPAVLLVLAALPLIMRRKN